jgi:endogenous inhibitor of DNA gyrase (YacG/DUF329 family)
VAELKKSPTCTICTRPVTEKFTPFCSKRCADIDLGRWFSETYRIPASAPDPQAGEDDNFAG